MKRFTTLILLTVMILTLSACGTDKTTSTVNSQTTKNKRDTNSSQQSNSETADRKPELNTSSSQSTKHTHKYTAKTTSATCSEQGYTTYICSCGYSYKDNYVKGKHEYVNQRCKYCGKADLDNLYSYLKSWVIDNGKVNGDYTYYTKSADIYGGYGSEDFSLYFWNDGNGTLEFCLHSVLDNTYSVNFYLYIPKTHTGSYEYISSYYYRTDGTPKYESKGTIKAETFTKNSPLNSTKYTGNAAFQNDFMEMSRVGVCDALDCLKQFLQKENTGYTLSDLGFTRFN